MRALGLLGVADASCCCTAKKGNMYNVEAGLYVEGDDMPHAPLYNVRWGTVTTERREL